MNELLNQILEVLKNHGIEAYPSFDMIPVIKKSKNLFVVIMPEKFHLDFAFADGLTGSSPFTAEFRISVLTPVTVPGEMLVSFFDTEILPVLQTIGLYELQTGVPEIDLKLQKQVYSGLFRMKGLCFPTVS